MKELANSSKISNNLQGLNYEELSYFLIISSDSSDRYHFTDIGKTTNEQRAIYKSLMDKSLLTFTERKDNVNNLIVFDFKTTTIGEKAHKVLLDTIYSEIVKLK